MILGDETSQEILLAGSNLQPGVSKIPKHNREWNLELLPQVSIRSEHLSIGDDDESVPMMLNLSVVGGKNAFVDSWGFKATTSIHNSTQKRSSAEQFDTHIEIYLDMNNMNWGQGHEIELENTL